MQLAQQRGLTLIELLISLTIGLIVLGAASSVFVTTIVNSAASISASRLNQELMTLMNVMVHDIRRAGYWKNAGSAPAQNPFNTETGTALAVIPSTAGGSSGQCILYTYDSNDTGSVEDTNLFGFRLNNGVVQMRLSGVAASAKNDDCNSDVWNDLTDPNLVNVTNLTFDTEDAAAPSTCLNVREPNGVENGGDVGVDDDKEFDCYEVQPTVGSGDITVETRQIAITLEGELVSDREVRVSITQLVRVRNDLVRKW
ncbi:PilW family protein [uncultured Microbulbifer sp.]|uniref:PilW family protein n=1 Tax=uncultured Microbulbifer sp. TaxID=348147 RepID=UPI0025FA21C5|nr:prepilin-type N-terminal cleavage/methylation domain-containing protein [uncultured Microbulbifer sp.]